MVFTPLTYKVVNALKRAEHEDYYDRQTDFNSVLAENLGGPFQNGKMGATIYDQTNSRSGIIRVRAMRGQA